MRKIISTRYSLTTEECDIKYKKVDPVISFEEEKIKFPTNEIGYISSDFEQKLPTQEEIEFAQKYNDKVFNIVNHKEDALNIEFKNDSNEDNNSDNNYEDNNSLKIDLIPK